MASNRYLALLRGINVGGRNIIRMVDLKCCFEELGCLDVATFIQSGNVIFRPESARQPIKAKKFEQALSARFGYESRVVLVKHSQLLQIVTHAPAGFGQRAAHFKYDVIFLREPLTATEAMKSVSLKPGVDAAHRGKGVLYFSRSVARRTQSHLPKLAACPAYQNMTIRNWNTTTKLLALMENSP